MAERARIIRHGCFSSALERIVLGMGEWQLSALATGEWVSSRRLP